MPLWVLFNMKNYAYITPLCACHYGRGGEKMLDCERVSAKESATIKKREVHEHTHLHTPAHTHTHTKTCTRPHKRTHTHTNIYAHLHTHKHTRTHTHT